jgi:hypothetical protein
MLLWRYGIPPSDQATTTDWKRGQPIWIVDDSSPPITNNEYSFIGYAEQVTETEMVIVCEL